MVEWKQNGSLTFLISAVVEKSENIRRNCELEKYKKGYITAKIMKRNITYLPNESKAIK